MTKRRVYGALAGVVLVSAIVLAAVFGMAQDEPLVGASAMPLDVPDASFKGPF